jgi:putative transposase
MKGKRFSEEQTIRILHEAETLDNVREVCRQHNSAEQTLYRCGSSLAGWTWLTPSGGYLERENAALKRLVGELTLDNRMLKDVLGKNW